jgi:hypothetical protein
MRRNSLAALNMASQMVVDAARYHRLDTTDVRPFCCYFNLREARQHLQQRNGVVFNEALSRDIECLLECEEQYRKEWVF